MYLENVNGWPPKVMGKKEYVSSKNVSDVRQHYQTRYKLQPFAGNYSHSKKYAATNWLCRCLEAREEEYHLTLGKCKLFGDLHNKFWDLSEDENLLKNCNVVLARRDEFDSKKIK